MQEEEHSPRTARTALEVLGDDLRGSRAARLKHPRPLMEYDEWTGDFVESLGVTKIFCPVERREMVRLLQEIAPMDTAASLIAPDLVPTDEIIRKATRDMERLLDRIGQRIPSSERRDRYAAERAKAAELLTKGELPEDCMPELRDPECQLLWAGVLGLAWTKGSLGEHFSSHPSVRKVLDSQYVRAFVGDFCEHLMNHGHGNTLLRFGPPGSWFYQDPVNRLINMDLCYSLCMGGDMAQVDMEGRLFRCHGHFESIFYHEAGHARLSQQYPPTLEARWDRMRELAIKGGLDVPPARAGQKEKPVSCVPGEGLSIEEYKEFNILSQEYRLVQHAWNAAEDNVVNAYMRGLSKVEDSNRRHPIDLGDAFNVASVIVNFAGDMVREYTGDKRPEPVQGPGSDPVGRLVRQISDASHAINMCFYIDNDFLPDLPASWEALHVDFNALRNNLPAGLRGGMGAEEVKEELQLLARAIREAQPDILLSSSRKEKVDPQREADLREMARELGIDDLPASPEKPLSLKEQAQYYSALRNCFIQHFFNRYIEPVMAELRPLLEEKMEEAFEEMKRNPRKGQRGGGRPIIVKGLPPGMGQTIEVPGMPGGSPQSDKSQQQQQQSGGQAGKPDQPPQGKPQEGQGKGPQQGQAEEEKPGQGKQGKPPGKKQEKTPPPQERTVAEHGRENRDKHEGPEGRPEGQEASKQAMRGERMRIPGQPAPGGGLSAFGRLTLGDGRSFSELREDPLFNEAVEEVASRLVIASRNIQQPDSRSAEDRHRFTPPVGRSFGESYDGQKDLRIQRQQQLGEPLHLRDLANIRDEVEFIRPTEGDLILLVDGSGSMGCGPGSVMEVAMKTSALLKLAGDRAGYRTYIVLWGNSVPDLVSAPGMDKEEENANIDGIINGKMCGTCLAPAVPFVLEKLKDTQPSFDLDGMPKRHGYTHFFVVSDGGTFDDNLFGPMFSKIMEKMPAATVDGAITSATRYGYANMPGMEGFNIEDYLPLSRTLRNCAPSDRPAVISQITGKQEAPEQVLQMVERRLEQCQPGLAQDEATYVTRVGEALDEVKQINPIQNPDWLVSEPVIKKVARKGKENV